MEEKPNTRTLLLFVIIVFVLGFLIFSTEIDWFWQLVIFAFVMYFVGKLLGLVGQGKYKFPEELK
jgi:hypothetical protein